MCAHACVDVCVWACVCVWERERGGGKGSSIINRIIPVKSTKTFVLHHFGRHLYKQSPGTERGPQHLRRINKTRELISAQKTSHLNTTKTWVTCGNSHLACKEIHVMYIMYINSTRGTSKAIQVFVVVFMCDVFPVLINSLVCIFWESPWQPALSHSVQSFENAW